jgi:hypothetical protein
METHLAAVETNFPVVGNPFGGREVYLAAAETHLAMTETHFPAAGRYLAFAQTHLVAAETNLGVAEILKINIL